MNKITQAFILAAGRGTRMLHLTDDKPKPLVTVGGKCLIDYNADHLKDCGVKECFVNLCYKGDMIREHLTRRGGLDFVFSEETEALETGGGIKHALPLMRNEPFFVINSDALWTDDASENLLSNMEKAWFDGNYDILLMLQPQKTAYGAGANGDYTISDGKPHRRHETSQKAPYIYGGVLICRPEIFADEPEGRYSMVKLFDKAEKTGTLGAYIHRGKWFHVGDPAAREIAEKYFSAQTNPRNGKA